MTRGSFINRIQGSSSRLSLEISSAGNARILVFTTIYTYIHGMADQSQPPFRSPRTKAIPCFWPRTRFSRGREISTPAQSGPADYSFCEYFRGRAREIFRNRFSGTTRNINPARIYAIRGGEEPDGYY